MTFRIYLMKHPTTNSLTHYVLEKDSLGYGYDYTSSSTPYLPRPFERQISDVLIS